MPIPEKKNTEKARSVAKSIQDQEVKVEKTPSLKDTLTKISNISSKKQEESISNHNDVIGSVGIKENKKIDESKLNESMEVFIERIKIDFPRFYSAIKLYPAAISDEGVVTLIFQNQAIVDDFKIRIKPSLLSHIRNSLEAEFIEITEEVVEAEQMEKPTIYSDQEKLQHMISKNQSLQTLKSLFNLDFDR